MIKQLFTIARSDKKSRKKALEHLKHQGLIEAGEVLGGKKEGDNAYGDDHFIRDQASNHINDNYQNYNEIS
jgi:hypothetical protein